MSPNADRRRVLWLRSALTASGTLIVALLVLMGFEIATGRISGTVIQATITDYGIGSNGLGKLNIQGCRLPSKDFDLHLDSAPVAEIGTTSVHSMNAGLAWCRRSVWKAATFGPSMAFALDKPASVKPLVSTGDVLSLRPGESVVLLTYETNYSTDRWAVVLRCDPVRPLPVGSVTKGIP